MDEALQQLRAVAQGEPGGAVLQAARSAVAKLASAEVSVRLLLSNGAGKVVRSLAAHPDALLASACADLYGTWRARVVAELQTGKYIGDGDADNSIVAPPGRKRRKVTRRLRSRDGDHDGKPSHSAASPPPLPPQAEGEQQPLDLPSTTAAIEAAMQAARHGGEGARAVLVHCRKQRLDLNGAFRARFPAFPAALHYTAKTWMLVQDECNTAFFFSYEFGPKCQGPNAGSAYLKLVDSVTYAGLWRPSHHVALQAYVEQLQLQGFTRFYVWACSAQVAADQGVFYAYPDKPSDQGQRQPATTAQLCEWYEKLCAGVVAATARKRGRVTARLERWSPRTPLEHVPCFGMGKSWPFTPQFAAHATEAEIANAEQRARAAMLKHGKSVFVVLLEPTATVELPPAGTRVAVRAVREAQQPKGKTVCSKPQEIVSFCCRHGLSFATEALARQATTALLHAVRNPEGTLDDGCCRTCNVCNNYFNVMLDPHKHCARVDGSGDKEFDVCGVCDASMPWHVEQFLAANPGYVARGKGWRQFTCTLPPGMCSCSIRRR